MNREISWGNLADELEKTRATGPIEAIWMAYEGNEESGIWLLPTSGPALEERRARLGLCAAEVIRKRGIPPVTVPQPLEYCPGWREMCQAEEDSARREGKSLDLSNAVPFGLGTVDRDAVDPCTRTLLELLRRESAAYRTTCSGTQTIGGKQYRTINGAIDDVSAALLAYVKRCARDEIGKRLRAPADSGEGRPAKRGRRPNEERRTAIQEEIMRHGAEWRDHLGEIFEELDRGEIPLEKLHGRRIDVGDGEITVVKQWVDLDLAQGEERKQITDLLRKYANPRRNSQAD